MAELMDMARAKETFATLCAAMDGNNWKYKKDEENLAIQCGVQGDDLPMEIVVTVDAKRCVVLLLSKIPIQTPEDKRLQMAVAVSAVNNSLVDGCFDFDIQSGKMFFRMTNSFMASKLSASVFHYMLAIACRTVDEYNDKFLMLGKGMLSLEQFLAAECN